MVGLELLLPFIAPVVYHFLPDLIPNVWKWVHKWVLTFGYNVNKTRYISP